MNVTTTKPQNRRALGMGPWTCERSAGLKSEFLFIEHLEREWQSKSTSAHTHLSQTTRDRGSSRQSCAPGATSVCPTGAVGSCNMLFKKARCSRSIAVQAAETGR